MERGFVVWFTGPSGSGKSTLACALESLLRERGLKVEVLDGDVVRTNLSKGPGFSKQDRDTNIRRIGFVCKLLARNAVAAIAAAISPYREVRDEDRREIGDFVEVYVKCFLDVLVERDAKGLYTKALRGEIQGLSPDGALQVCPPSAPLAAWGPSLGRWSHPEAWTPLLLSATVSHVSGRARPPGTAPPRLFD